MSELAVTAGARLVSTELVEDRINGSSTVYTYEAGSKDAIVAQRLIEIAFGATHLQQRPRRDGYYELVATYPFDTERGPSAEPATDVHELETDVIQSDIYTSPKLRKVFAPNEDDMMHAIQRTVSNYEGGEYKNKTAAEAALHIASMDIVNDTSVAEKAKRIFRRIAYMKVTSFIEYSSVYRRTLQAASPLQVRASFTGVGKIWTTNEMRLFEVLPDDWWFTLPTDYQWLKSQPTVHTVAGQKTQIAYSYTQAKQAWAAAYDPYGSAVLLDSDLFPNS